FQIILSRPFDDDPILIHTSHLILVSAQRIPLIPAVSHGPPYLVYYIPAFFFSHSIRAKKASCTEAFDPSLISGSDRITDGRRGHRGLSARSGSPQCRSGRRSAAAWR